MRMTVDTLETEFVFGNIRELRGNFKPIERETEAGVVTEYECDYYRTTGNETFEQLDMQYKAKEAQAYLDATDWVVAQLGEYQMLGKKLPDRSDILTKREESRNTIRGLLREQIPAEVVNAEKTTE